MDLKKDDRFQSTAKAARARQARRDGAGRRLWQIRALIGVALSLVLGGLTFVFWPRNLPEPVLTQSPETAETAMMLAAAGAAAVLDTPGEPLIIRLPEKSDANLKEIMQPDALDLSALGSRPRLFLVREPLISRGVELNMTLPSSPADLIAFQVRRDTAAAQHQTQHSGDVARGSKVTLDTDDGSWGDEIAGVTGSAGQVSYVETRIENTTTQTLVIEATRRKPLYHDMFLSLDQDVRFGQLATRFDISQGEAERIENAIVSLTGLAADLPAGTRLAVRKMPGAPVDARVSQIALFGPAGYIATVTQIGAGRFRTGANPWLGIDRKCFATSLLCTSGLVFRRDSCI